MEAHPPAQSPTARTRLILADLPAAERLDRWREALEPVYEIALDPANDLRKFTGAITMAHLGDALLSEVESGPQSFERSRVHARRTGLDHFLVQTFRHGRHRGLSGASEVERGPGDVWVFDLGQEIHTRAVRFANISLVIPRDRVLPLLTNGEVHGATLRHGAPSARLVASHLEALVATAPSLTLAEATAGVDALLLMIAGAWSSLRESRPEIGAAVRATARHTVRDYIDRHLADDQLNPGNLARLFNMSRATLYRLFEEEGGVAAYIQGRRLDRCRAIFVSEPLGRRTISEIAYDHGFGSDAHFSRAFRRRFGISPRDVRDAGAAIPRTPGRDATETPAVWEWLTTLRRPSSGFPLGTTS